MYDLESDLRPGEVRPHEESTEARSRRTAGMLRGAERLEKRAHELILEAAALRKLAAKLQAIGSD